MKKFAVLALLLVCACGQIPQTRYFTIDYDYQNGKSAAGNGVLYIKKFKSEPLYFQDKLIYKTSRYEVKFDNYRRWVLTPADLLTQKAAEHLDHAGLYTRVTLNPPTDRVCYTLESTVKNFEEIVENNQRYALVTILFELEQNEQSGIVWAEQFTARTPIIEKGEEGIIAAMSASTRQVFDELVVKLAK
ncbi:MAG TPA: ABC-type transport auxiliary lipoprotein family protein [bacterium]|nr:ABC-type transport auxiliary lipoprotein family protein [bacterium]HPN45005.1 ABC-type transport auxiliary lipoprotein family protein [bacterium]